VVVVVATTTTILYLITHKERKYSRLLALAHIHTSYTEERREKERREERQKRGSFFFFFFFCSAFVLHRPSHQPDVTGATRLEPI